MRIAVPFFGGSAQARGVQVSNARTINLFPELTARGLTLYGTPGLDLFASLGANPVRGWIRVDELVYAVSAGTFYEIDASGTVTNRGAIGTTAGRVSMAHNGAQVCIVDGTAGYTYTIATTTLATIADPDFPNGADHVAFLDGYFIVDDDSASDRFAISNLYDGTNWTATDVARAEADPDALVRPFVDNRDQLVLFGERTTEFWSNTGNLDFPLERIQGATAPVGLHAPWSVALCAHQPMFLAQDEEGGVWVARLSGYTAERVSTPEIETQINSFASASDAVAFGYSEQGRWFYCISFPTGDRTFVFDPSIPDPMVAWHERSSDALTVSDTPRWRADLYLYAFGKRLVSDAVNGSIYSMSLSTYTENGARIVRQRQGQVIADMHRTVFHREFELQAEMGIGNATPPGDDPQAMLKWSNDGGRTFGYEHWRSLGKVGEYKTRTRWLRLGQARDRVYQVRVTDPVQVALHSAWLVLEVES